MINQKIVEFILECRKRGFDDWQIKEPLLKHGWPVNVVNEAFGYLAEKENKKVAKSKNNKSSIKNAITIYLDDELVKAIDKRAKKNMMNFNEQIEDILRRSCLSLKKQHSIVDKELDDKFIGLFSRRRAGGRTKL
jgi:hypothetical protein